MKKYSSAGIIVFRTEKKHREYLLLKYSSGHWDLAKGKIEEGESQKEAALRELQEEAGISAHLIDGFEESFSYYFEDYGKGMAHKNVTFFLGEYIGDCRVSLSHEHIDYTWLPYEKALAQLTHENAQLVLKKAEHFMISERQ